MRYFIGIGAQKAGTTWLYDQLITHPEIAMPPRKELHFFDLNDAGRSGNPYGVHMVDGLIRAIREGKSDYAIQIAEVLRLSYRRDDAYARYLASFASERTSVCGEITPAYSALTSDGFSRMRAMVNPRIVFLMRDPLSRYWSAVRMLSRRRPELVGRNFKTLIDHPATWSRSDYTSTLESLDEVFDPADVHVEFYENLFRPEAYRGLLRFLGVSQDHSADFGATSRVGDSRQMPEVPERVRERLAPIYSYVRERFGNRVPDEWKDVH